jgi:hypothetical protein
MRKIGYSVGLEDTFNRIGDLEELYIKTRDVTLSSWNELVRGPGHWNLKSENIADVFFSLRLIQLIPGDLLVLENLDALAITNKLLNDEEQKKRARAFIMLWAILVNDGEIFVNLLLSGFEKEKIKEKLRAVIMHKRTVMNILPSLDGKNGANRINRVINIERQEKNKGSSGAGQSVASLKRTTPLEAEKMRVITNSENEAITFSEDYFRKVPPRRKDWARSLKLWEDKDGLTQRGKEFISRLTESGYIDENGLFIFWPMDYELVKAGFKPNLLGKQSKSLWDCLIDFGNAYSHLQISPTPISDKDKDDVVKQTEKMLEVFRSLHARKAMLRREIPITIAYVAAVSYACAVQMPILNFPVAIDEEQKGNKRRVAFRRSRNTGGALSMMK